MKRTTRLLVVMLFLVTMFGLLMPVQAADNDAVVVSLPDVSGEVGETVVVPVTLSSNPGIVSLEMEIDYDASKIALVEAENTRLLPGNFTTSEFETVVPYMLMWVDGTAMSNNTKTGVIAYLTFEILEGCRGSSSALTITFDPEDVFDVYLNNVQASAVNGSIHGHKYANPVWNFIEDPINLTVTFTCACGETKTSNVPFSVVEKEPTCTEAGYKDIHASVTMDGVEYTYDNHFDYPALGHAYGEPIWIWSGEGMDLKAEARFACSRCGDKQTVQADVTVTEYQPLSYRSDSWTKATAVATFGTSQYTNYYNAIGNALMNQGIDFHGAAITLGTVKGRAGESVTVPVTVSGNPGMVGLALDIYYDSSKMILTGVENTGLMTGDFTTSEFYDVEPYLLMWVDGTATKNNTANGVIANLTFTILESTADGEIPVYADYDPHNLFDASLNPVLFELIDGSVKVTKATPGDVNDDGYINARDIALLQRYVAGWTVTINEDAADLNGDGIPNAKDIALLQRLVAGWTVVLK